MNAGPRLLSQGAPHGRKASRASLRDRRARKLGITGRNLVFIWMIHDMDQVEALVGRCCLRIFKQLQCVAQVYFGRQPINILSCSTCVLYPLGAPENVLHRFWHWTFSAPQIDDERYAVAGRDVV
jgi:hypothetical protein